MLQPASLSLKSGRKKKRGGGGGGGRIHYGTDYLVITEQVTCDAVTKTTAVSQVTQVFPKYQSTKKAIQCMATMCKKWAIKNSGLTLKRPCI